MREGITLHPARPVPMPAVTAILARFDRPMLEAAIEVMIGLLDAADGDADAEPIDEREADADQDADPAYTEWHTRGGRKLAANGIEPIMRADGHGQALDDDEDDDAAEQDDEPEGIGDDQDVAWPERGTDTQMGLFPGRYEDAEDDDEREQEYPVIPSFGIDQTAGPVPEALTAVRVANDA